MKMYCLQDLQHKKYSLQKIVNKIKMYKYKGKGKKITA